ncbi:MAG: methyltransferase domain-containing protein [Rhizobiaceae bacterium]|nr:methyltransferase domain-containing protein [Rhizobiaceae bacterium]
MDWEERARPWIEAETELEELHKNVGIELIQRAPFEPGMNILDIGCGSGSCSIAAANAVGPTGHVTAVDIAPPLARRTSQRTASLQQVEVKTGDAQTLDLGSGTIDLAISQFGVMFFADPKAAFSNINSALRPSGRLLFAAWAGPMDNPWFSGSRKIAEVLLPDLPAAIPTAPGPLSLANSERTIAILHEAGFENVSVETVDLTLDPIGSAADVSKLQFKIGQLAAWIDQSLQDGDDAAELALDCQAKLTKFYSTFETGNGVSIPAKVHFYSAFSRA